jgi:hypothetical protein
MKNASALKELAEEITARAVSEAGIAQAAGELSYRERRT